MKQRTIKREVSFSGIGLHTEHKSRVTFKPADAGKGVFFVKNGVVVKPDVMKVANTVRGTTIGEGKNEIHTVEHLMAAFFGMGIDNVCVEIDSDEPPIGDGSAMPFVGMIERAGVVEQAAERKYYVPSRKITYGKNGIKIEAVPSEELKISLTLEYDHPMIKKQEMEITITEEVFKKEIAPAKTYCFDYEIEQLENIGLGKGGNLENAIVIGEKNIHNREIMTFEDEFVRHKILDLMGDIYLIGRPTRAAISSVCGGHSSNAALAKLFAQDLRISAESDAGGKMENNAIELDLEKVKETIPQRPPFLFVDSVTIEEPRKKAVGKRKIRADEWYFKGHFPGYPILPGVLMIEALAQAASTILLVEPEFRGKLPFFMGVDKVKFRRPVRPGDELTLKVEVIRARLRGGKVEGKAYVGEELACECELMFSLVDK